MILKIFFKTNMISHKISSEDPSFNSLQKARIILPSLAHLWTALKTMPTDKHSRHPYTPLIWLL